MVYVSAGPVTGLRGAHSACCVVRGDEEDSRDEEIKTIGCNPRRHGLSPATPQLNIEY